MTLVLESSSNWQNVDLVNSKVVGSSSQQYNLLIKAGQAGSAYFPIMPMTIGTIPVMVRATSKLASDAVVRQLRVEVKPYSAICWNNKKFKTVKIVAI